jgi:hypothetical protein
MFMRSVTYPQPAGGASRIAESAPDPMYLRAATFAKKHMHFRELT